MGLSRRRFTREFKLEAVQRLESGASVAEVARAFEVKANGSTGKQKAWPVAVISLEGCF
jgi:Transposase